MDDDERLSRSTVGALIEGGLRSLAASIPGAASLGQAWSEYENHKQSERIEKFFRALTDALKRLESRIRAAEEHIVKSGELPDLMQRAVSSSQRANDDRKIKVLADALASSLAAGAKVKYEDKLNILDTLDSLTYEDIQVLSYFSQGRILQVDQIFRNPELRGSTPDDKLGLLVHSLSKLDSRGIVGETTPETFRVVGGVGNPGSWFNRWRERYYVLLPFGKLLVDALQAKL